MLDYQSVLFTAVLDSEPKNVAHAVDQQKGAFLQEALNQA